MSEMSAALSGVDVFFTLWSLPCVLDGMRCSNFTAAMTLAHEGLCLYLLKCHISSMQGVPLLGFFMGSACCADWQHVAQEISQIAVLEQGAHLCSRCCLAPPGHF